MSEPKVMCAVTIGEELVKCRFFGYLPYGGS